MAADCCRADRAPQAATPAVGPVTITKKELKIAAQTQSEGLFLETAAATPAHPLGEILVRRSGAREPSIPLFLKNAALLI